MLITNGSSTGDGKKEEAGKAITLSRLSSF